MAEQRQRDEERRRLDLRMSAIGIQFAISILLGAGAGFWLDNRFETGPWLLLAGVLLGSASAYRDLWTLNRQMKRLSDQG